MNENELVRLAESLLTSEWGVDEDSFNLLIDAAVTHDYNELLGLLRVADATDGMFYLRD